MYKTLDPVYKQMRELVVSIYSGLVGIALTLESLKVNLIQHGVEHCPPKFQC